MRKVLSRRKFSLVGAGCLLLFCAIGCKGDPNGTDANAGRPDLVVGSLLALSGDGRSFGITQQRGMKIALEEVNAEGGINGKPLKIEYADTKLDEDLGVQEYKRLVGDVGVDAIVGITGSGVNLRLAPRAAKDQVLLFDSLATSPKLTTEGGKFFFRNIASDAYAGFFLSQWAMERGHKRAALIYNSEDSWSNGLKSGCEAQFVKAGGTWATEPTAVLDSTDNFTAAIVSMREKNVDAIFVCLMGRQAGLFVSQARANQLQATFYGTDPFSQQEFIDNAKDAAEGSLFLLPEVVPERYSRFEAKYLERYDDKADSIAAKAYDSVHALAVALRAAEKVGELTGANIRQALATTEYEGITGPNAFDENNDLRAVKFGRFTYSDGELKEVDEEPQPRKKAA